MTLVIEFLGDDARAITAAAGAFIENRNGSLESVVRTRDGLVDLVPLDSEVADALESFVGEDLAGVRWVSDEDRQSMMLTSPAVDGRASGYWGLSIEGLQAPFSLPPRSPLQVSGIGLIAVYRDDSLFLASLEVLGEFDWSDPLLALAALRLEDGSWIVRSGPAVGSLSKETEDQLMAWLSPV